MDMTELLPLKVYTLTEHFFLFCFRLWPFNFEEEGVNIIRHWLRCESTKVLKRSLLDGFMGEQDDRT